MTCELYTDETGVCGATPTRRYLAGPRCAPHSPAALAGHPDPDPEGSRPPQSPQRVRIAYGTATSDPLGRDGPGWHIGKDKLPKRDKVERDFE